MRSKFRRKQMRAQRGKLAKITPPASKEATPRERVFRLIDERRSKSVLWVCGPSGAGKTMLVASYLEKRKRSVIWINLDRGDRDGATFFYYLGLAAGAGKRRALPLLTPEYLPDIARFAHRFFRDFFALLPAKSAVVFDNWQELDDIGALQEALCCACEEVPIGMQLILLSRHEPPLALARLRAHGRIALLGWQELRLTPEESMAIATALQPALGETSISALHARTNGWVTGLRLLLESTADGNTVMAGETKLETSAEGGIFDYFAGEMFRQSSPEVRDLWLRTALMPRFGAKAAKELSGDAQAERVADELCRRHLFIEKRAAEQSYEYHALFRDFLVRQARRELSDAQFVSLQRQSASLLLAAGELEDAVDLYLEAHAWDDATRLILQQAGTLLARGRGATLSAAILRLPGFRVDTNPRLLYSLGAAQIPLDAARGRRYLQRAHKCFSIEGNAVGEALAIAGILEAYYYEFSSYIGVEEWIDKLVRLLEPGLIFPSPEAEVMTYAWLLMAMTMRSPAHEFIPFCAERVTALIERGAEVNRIVVAGALLLNHFDYFADDKARHVGALIEPHLNAAALTPFNRLWWLLTQAQHCLQIMDHARLKESFTQARHVIEASGLRATPMLERYIAFWEQVASGEVAHASSLAPRVQAMLDPKRQQERLLFAWLAGVVELARGNTAHARNYADEYVKVASETGSECMLVWGFGLAALTTCMVGEHTQARHLLASAQSRRTPWHGERIDYFHHLVDAYIHLVAGDHSQAEATLEQAFGVGRRRNYLHTLPWVPPVMARLCALALESGIEVDYATRLIRARRLTAPGSDNERWPWPIRIRGLGQFEIYVNDAPLKSNRKAPKKPLELLKLLVALGGTAVSSQHVCDALWPDSEGDAAPKALSMALYRLRKLLGNDASVVLHDGKLSLNRELCWTDVWALEALAATNSDAASTVARASALYRGEFASSDLEHAWMLEARERWQTRYVRLVVDVAEGSERVNDWSAALNFYRHAVESASTAQELHRRIMLCYLKLNQREQAVQAYNHCQDVLRARGFAPDSRLERLRAEAERNA